MKRRTGWQTYVKDTDHLTGSSSLLVRLYMEAALCPSDYIRTAAEVRLTSPQL